MKKLLLLIIILTSISYAYEVGKPNQVLVVPPSGGNRMKPGAVNLSSPDAVTGELKGVNIENRTITQSKLSIPTIYSASCSIGATGCSGSNSAYACNMNITTTGRPILFLFKISGQVGFNNGTFYMYYVQLYRGDTSLGNVFSMLGFKTSPFDSNLYKYGQAGTFSMIDIPTSGTYEYKFYLYISLNCSSYDSSGSFLSVDVKAFEL